MPLQCREHDLAQWFVSGRFDPVDYSPTKSVLAAHFLRVRVCLCFLACRDFRCVGARSPSRVNEFIPPDSRVAFVLARSFGSPSMMPRVLLSGCSFDVRKQSNPIHRCHFPSNLCVIEPNPDSLVALVLARSFGSSYTVCCLVAWLVGCREAIFF